MAPASTHPRHRQLLRYVNIARPLERLRQVRPKSTSERSRRFRRVVKANVVARSRHLPSRHPKARFKEINSTRLACGLIPQTTPNSERPSPLPRLAWTTEALEPQPHRLQ